MPVTQVTHISYMTFSFLHDISMTRQISTSKKTTLWRQRKGHPPRNKVQYPSIADRLGRVLPYENIEW